MNAKAVLLLALGHLTTDLAQGAIPIMLPFLKEAFSLTYAMSGAIVMTMNLTSSVMQPLFGYFTDRIKGGWLMPAGMMTAGVGFGVIGLAPSYPFLLASVVLCGLGVASFHPEGFRRMSAFAGARKVTATSWFMVGGNLGNALGPLLATTYVVWLGLKGTLLFAPPGIILALTFPLLLGRLSRASLAGRAPAPAPPPQPIGDRLLPLGLLILTVTMRSWVHAGVTAYLPFYYVHVLGGDPVTAGQLITLFLAAGAVGTLLGAPVADRVGHKTFYVVSLFILAPCLALLLVTQGPWLILVLCLAGGVTLSNFTVTIVMAQQILPDRAGLAAGLVVGLALGMGGIGATFLGGVADHFGLPAVLKIIAAMPLLAGLAAILIPYKSQRQG